MQWGQPSRYAQETNYLFQTSNKTETRITIPWETSMEDIKTHPAYWFLLQIQEFNRSKLMTPFEDALHMAKILSYATYRERSTSPSLLPKTSQTTYFSI